MGSNEILPYWNINVPESERTLTCPEALLHLSEKDLHIISTPNKDFQRQTWARVQDLVRSNHLESLQRVPSELRRYRIFTYNIAKQFGSVANFILSQRLQWEAPVQLRSRPFENPDDIKILYNDWPYGIDPRIVHLVVWTKFSLQNDPATGDLTDSARDEIASFVSDNFLRHMPEDKVSLRKAAQDSRHGTC